MISTPSDELQQEEEEGSATISYDDVSQTASFLDRFGQKMELKMTEFFTAWGATCATYPIPVMVLSVAFAVGLTTGVSWLQVETDPIELWASSTSRARLEKDYYDQTFRPFYRTEQIIIHAKNLESVSLKYFLKIKPRLFSNLTLI